MSPDASQASDNLGGSKTAERQASRGDTRVWFAALLARGRFGVTVFTDVAGFPGETSLGAGMVVDRLPRLLRRMLGPDAPKPRTLFTDRGPGFYAGTGSITAEYDAACRRNGFGRLRGPRGLRGLVQRRSELRVLFVLRR